MVGLGPHETAFVCIAPGLGDRLWLEDSLLQYSCSGPPKPVNKDAYRYALPTARTENIGRGTLTRVTVPSLILPPYLLVGCARSTVVRGVV